MKTLRIRLTWLYTVTTALILTAVIAGVLLIQIRETRQNQIEQFYTAWNLLSARLQTDTLISQSFLAQTEADNLAVIHIEENQIPLMYPGSWAPITPRQTLIEKAKAQAAAEGVDTSVAPVSASANISSFMSLEGEEGESYYAMVLVTTRERRMRSICLIAYRPSVMAVLRPTVLFLAFMELLGILGLFLISWNFVGWSLKPAEESQQKQAEFIASASHELRSPLSVLRSGASAIKAELDQVPGTSAAGTDAASNPMTARVSDICSILGAFDRECVRMSHLIDDMLLLASADAGTWSARMQTVDMDTLLIETYDACMPICRQKNLSLFLDLPDQALPPVTADPERIRQILLILIDNAAAYTPAGKEIRIQAEISGTKACPAAGTWLNRLQNRLSHSESSWLTIRVTDQGCGISDEAKPHIFDRFYRADPSRSEKSHFGLGLSIARELVLLHRGTIRVSDAPGGGSCFTIQLPA